MAEPAPTVFEFDASTGLLPEQWLLRHGALPKGAQITLQLEDGTSFSGVQFYGVVGDIGPGAHQIIAERDALSAHDTLRVVPYVWTPDTGLRAAMPGEVLSLEPITAAPGD